MTTTIPANSTPHPKPAAAVSPAVGPEIQARLNHDESRIALRAAVARTTRMWRRVTDSGAPVPRLTWTVGETAAHMLGDLRDYTAALTRHQRGYDTHPLRAGSSPTELSAQVNARHLAAGPERNVHRLGAELERAADEYLDVVARIGAQTPILAPNGLFVDAPTMTGLLLAEQLVHGRDIAEAAGRMWDIPAADAQLAIPAVLRVAPHYLRPEQVDRPISFEVRIRGGQDYRLAVCNGTATISAAGDPVDCVLTADPVAALLIGFGRITPWVPVLRGHMSVGGRRPWRAMRFATLFAAP